MSRRRLPPAERGLAVEAGVLIAAMAVAIGSALGVWLGYLA